jgi:hypothetical protein
MCIAHRVYFIFVCSLAGEKMKRSRHASPSAGGGDIRAKKPPRGWLKTRAAEDDKGDYKKRKTSRDKKSDKADGKKRDKNRDKKSSKRKRREKSNTAEDSDDLESAEKTKKSKEETQERQGRTRACGCLC